MCILSCCIDKKNSKKLFIILLFIIWLPRNVLFCCWCLRFLADFTIITCICFKVHYLFFVIIIFCYYVMLYNLFGIYDCCFININKMCDIMLDVVD